MSCASKSYRPRIRNLCAIAAVSFGLVLSESAASAASPADAATVAQTQTQAHTQPQSTVAAASDTWNGANVCNLELQSPDGKTRLSYNNIYGLFLYGPSGETLWKAENPNQNGGSMEMKDSQISIRNGRYRLYFESGTTGAHWIEGAPLELRVGNDGRLALLGTKTQTVFWDAGNRSLGVGQKLVPRQIPLVSPSREYQLHMRDGDAVIMRQAKSRITEVSRIQTPFHATSLVLDKTGNLKMMTQRSVVAWESNTSNAVAREQGPVELRVTNEGKLALVGVKSDTTYWRSS